MFNVFTGVLDTTGFVPRWHCGEWTPQLGWTMILSDVLIGGAYMAIPLVLVFYLLRRRDIPFPNVLWLFVTFIVACGVTHFIEAGIFWEPVYRLSAATKVLTAAVSWLTVLALFRVIPEALRYPGMEALNRKLKQANDDLEDFAHVVSHDLRAPLRGIRRVSEWLEESLANADDETKEHLELLRNRADKMDKLIQGVLLYSKVGRTEALNELVDTRTVVEDVLLSLAPEQRARISVAGEFPRIQADDIQVYQVFQNLIENALRFTNKPGGRVIITGRSGDKWHSFSVQDNGPGVKDEDRERIFRVFQTNEPSASLHAGLGLAIARKVVERNDGTMWLETPEWGGARFVFTWPVDVPPSLEPKLESVTA